MVNRAVRSLNPRALYTTDDQGSFAVRLHSFGIAVDRKHALKWLFHHRGPQRLVLVAGVEVKATLHFTQKVYVYSETALTIPGQDPSK